MEPFILSEIPKTYFGEGSFERIFDILHQIRCKSLLLVTGGQSFVRSERYDYLINKLNASFIKIHEARVTGEPSPEIVDEITASAKQEETDAVLSIGGGSVIDTGKAVSAMMTVTGGVKDYLEGVGTLNHDGSKIPFIAVPTTSGTGSEATKNAVLRKIGNEGFKKSLRHDNFVPDYAILDAVLSIKCPPQITAASGMDALNQLLEGYMSVKSSEFTDMLALSGIAKIFRSLETLYLKSPEDIELRGEMAYASYLSGIVLANAGLGYVHGFAGVIGGMADIPHGVVCGKLNACVFEAVAQRIVNDKERYSKPYRKLQPLASILGYSGNDKISAVEFIIDKLYCMEEHLNLPALSAYSISKELIERAVAKTSGKESHVKILESELSALVLSKL